MFIERSIKIHGAKYDYSQVNYKNMNTKVCIICPIHGEFWQTPHAHLKGYGCYKCGIEKRKKQKYKMDVYNTESFIQIANSIHNKYYDYSLVNYCGAYKPITIICPIHGEFKQTPCKHIHRKQGCPKCNGGVAYTLKDFIEKANIIHSNEYDYSECTYINNHTYVNIICHKKDSKGNEHGIFRQLACNHLSHHGCPKCKRSLLESQIAMFLNEHNIRYEQEKTFWWLKNKGKMRLDFYLPDCNIAIECQGQQHFEPYERFGGREKYDDGVRMDKLKYDLCKEHNIKIIYFSDFQYRKDIITDKNKILEIIKI